MERRYVSVWFRYLNTDWFSLERRELKDVPFVLKTSFHGRMIITSANAVAEFKGIRPGMVLADARAVYPDLEIQDDKPDLPERLLHRLAEWCIRFTPVVAIDLPDGLMLDATGCAHLWGGEEDYVAEIERKLQDRGYCVRVAIADTPAVAWAVARYGFEPLVIPAGQAMHAILSLPPEALRLDSGTIDRLHKLGLHQVRQFINLPRSSLRRRFGVELLKRIDMASGLQTEVLKPVVPVELYEERLPCMEPILTATGIELALETLLKSLCLRLQQNQKGLRSVVFKCFRTDGQVAQVETGTNQPSHNVSHLFRLFQLKLSSIDPGLGIELFVLSAPLVEDYVPGQEKIWNEKSSIEDVRLAELMDRIEGRIGRGCFHRFLPAEHHWPERSFKMASTLAEEPAISWQKDKLRPLSVLSSPEPIEVTAPIPDYPPMLFRYKGRLHKIIRADGPERIEQEWWLQQGQHRDYYSVEDEEGKRYWLFRLGHYSEKISRWFIHGFFS